MILKPVRQLSAGALVRLVLLRRKELNDCLGGLQPQAKSCVQ
jgi:hypothetical protein